MITTNLPEFFNLLNKLGEVNVHDSADTIELHVGKPVNVLDVDDLVCDALFADPVGREENNREWIIQLWKRDALRNASDMHVIESGSTSTYVVERAA